MEVDSPVWYQLKSDSKWIPATISNKVRNISGNYTVTIRLNDSGIKYTKFLDNNDCNELTDIKLRNDVEDDCKENLINLSHLNEATVLHCLEARYYHDDIYTFTGRILVACNPLKKIPQLYTPQVLDYYYQNSLQKFNGLETDTPPPPPQPHVYAVVDIAYWNMMKAIKKLNEANKASTYSDIPIETYLDQTILISGESGSGKTETTKHALKYLTSISTPRKTFETEIILEVIMDRIIQSNPILEAFGNARTTRNENSSRFGKFIVMSFNNRGHLVGGVLSTYLLEKVRITSQQRGERNFHIFYQLVSGCNEEERLRWFPESTAAAAITPRVENDFYYLNQGQLTTSMHLEDADNYILLKRALKILNFDTITQNSLLDAMIGILHLGQISFHPATTNGNESSDTSGSDRSDVMVAANPTSKASLALAAELFGVPVDSLLRAMTVRIINAKWESYEIHLTAIQAADARDSLARTLYDRIFSYLLVHINSSISVEKKRVRADIGVLDIFGFESFKRNSFEQLCINYANEILQSQFNQHIFRAEQMEYESENLSSDIIAFTDNQDCIQLIAHRTTGILGMLDDFCKLPKAAEDKFSQRLYKSFAGHERFSASVLQQRDHQFCVSHFAGPVVYSCKGFVEKNRNDVPKEAAQLFGGSALSLLSSLFRVSPSAEREPPPPPGSVAVSTASHPAYCQNPLSRSRGTSSTSAHSPPASPTTNDNKSVSSPPVTTGSQFKAQLQELADRINSMAPHYIRCIKPNDSGTPGQFDQLRVAQQLRNSGLIDALRVARTGFPVRFQHKVFHLRYQSLLHIGEQLDGIVLCDRDRSQTQTQTQTQIQGVQQPPLTKAGKLFSQSSKVLKEVQAAVFPLASALLPSDIQVGTTKLFLTQRAHDILESCLQARRRVLLDRAVAAVQAAYRDFIRRLSYRNEVNRLRHLCATRIQSLGRRYLCRLRYAGILSAILRLQYTHRRRLQRKAIAARQLHESIVGLQRLVRGMVARHHFLLRRKTSVLLQRRFRYRRSVRRRREAELRSRSIALQRVWRGVLGRRKYRQRHTAKEVIRARLVTLLRSYRGRRLQREKDEAAAATSMEKVEVAVETSSELDSHSHCHSKKRKALCDDDNSDSVEAMTGDPACDSTNGTTTTTWEDVYTNSPTIIESILVVAADVIPPPPPLGLSELPLSSTVSTPTPPCTFPLGLSELPLSSTVSTPTPPCTSPLGLSELPLSSTVSPTPPCTSPLGLSELPLSSTVSPTPTSPLGFSELPLSSTVSTPTPTSPCTLSRSHIADEDATVALTKSLHGRSPATLSVSLSLLSQEDTIWEEGGSAVVEVVVMDQRPQHSAIGVSYDSYTATRPPSYEEACSSSSSSSSNCSCCRETFTEATTSTSDVQVVFGCRSFHDLIDYRSDSSSSSSSSSVDISLNDNDNDNDLDRDSEPRDRDRLQDDTGDGDGMVDSDPAVMVMFSESSPGQSYLDLLDERLPPESASDSWVTYQGKVCTCQWSTAGHSESAYQFYEAVCSSGASSTSLQRREVVLYLNEIAALRRIIANKDDQLYQLRAELADAKELFEKELAAVEGRMMGDILSLKALYDIRNEEKN